MGIAMVKKLNPINWNITPTYPYNYGFICFITGTARPKLANISDFSSQHLFLPSNQGPKTGFGGHGEARAQLLSVEL
jgi:hypothetical protein